MLDTILITDATMIVGILFAEAIGRSFGIVTAKFMGRWMFLWGIASLLPFSISALLALTENEYAIWATGIGFIGFVLWFLFVSALESTGEYQRQYIVRETELESFLKEGYVVIAVLNSGDVVVE